MLLLLLTCALQSHILMLHIPPLMPQVANINPGSSPGDQAVNQWSHLMN